MTNSRASIDILHSVYPNVQEVTKNNEGSSSNSSNIKAYINEEPIQSGLHFLSGTFSRLLHGTLFELSFATLASTVLTHYINSEK